MLSFASLGLAMALRLGGQLGARWAPSGPVGRGKSGYILINNLIMTMQNWTKNQLNWTLKLSNVDLTKVKEKKGDKSARRT